MDGGVEVFFVPRAVVARDHDARADGDARKEAHQQEYEAPGGRDGGILRVVAVVAYDPCVGGVIKLLEDLPQQDGDRKKGQILPDRPLGQRNLVCFHGGKAVRLLCYRNS